MIHNVLQTPTKRIQLTPARCSSVPVPVRRSVGATRCPPLASSAAGARTIEDCACTAGNFDRSTQAKTVRAGSEEERRSLMQCQILTLRQYLVLKPTYCTRAQYIAHVRMPSQSKNLC